MGLPSNVASFAIAQEQNKYKTHDLRHLSNLTWFYRFELRYLNEHGVKESSEHDVCNKELDLIYKELKRRQHLGDKEAQEVLENWWN